MNACFINGIFGLIFLSLIKSSTSQWCTETNRSPGPAIMKDVDWMPPIVVYLSFKRVTPPCLYHECKITFPAAHAADHEARTISKIHTVRCDAKSSFGDRTLARRKRETALAISNPPPPQPLCANPWPATDRAKQQTGKYPAPEPSRIK